MSAIVSPYPFFPDLDGTPLTGGYLYFGQPTLNPETNPIPVYWDSDLTQPAAQPLRTIGGAVARDGAIAQLYAGGDYSLTVRNKRGTFVTGAQSIGLGFQAQGVGSISRSFLDKLRERVSVKDYGALGDGVHNDRPAIQACIDANPKALIVFPAGDYLCSDGTPILVTDATLGVKFRGDGKFSTKVRTSSSTVDLFTIACNNAVEFEGLWFSAPGANTGRLISLSGGATMNAYSVFRDCLFENGGDQIYTISALLYTIDNCIFSGFKNTGITVQNVYNPDAGDSTIRTCTFGSAATGLACIRQLSSGGLRVLSNKMNTGQYGYLMQCTGSTSDLLIDGNSIENTSIAALAFSWVSGSYSNVKIGANQIAITPIAVQMNSASAFLTTVTVDGLLCSAISQYGMLFDNVTDLSLGRNQLTGTAAVGSLGLLIGDGMGRVDADHQQISNFERRTNNLSTTASIYQQRTLLAFSSRAFTPTTGTAELGFPSSRSIIPLNCSMQTSGMIRASATFGTVSSDAGSKTLRAYVGGAYDPVTNILTGGTLIWSGVYTGVSQIRVSLMFGAAFGETNKQVTTAAVTVDGVAVTPLPILTAISMTAAQGLTWTYQKSVAADTLILYTLSVEALTQG